MMAMVNGRKIVIVEPDSNCREVTRLFFDGYAENGNKYKAFAFPGSKDALDSCEKETPYLIICDSNVPDWPELAEETARLYPESKFLLFLDPLPHEEDEVKTTAENYKTKELISSYKLKLVPPPWDESFPQILKELEETPYPMRKDMGLAEAAPWRQ